MITPKQFAQGDVPAAGGTAYTTPALTKAVILAMDFANTTGVAKAVIVHLVPSGGSPLTSNRIISNISIAGNGALNYRGVQVLHAGGFIYWDSSATGVTGTISGFEKT
jgi:hypothetical protein